MADLTPSDGSEVALPSVEDYKAMIAKTKLFRDAQERLRPMFQAFQANVAACTVAVLADKIGDRIDLNYIWAKQGVSAALLDQIATWSKEVNDVPHKSANGRMISEWAKKPECGDAVLGAHYSVCAKGIPEVH